MGFVDDRGGERRVDCHAEWVSMRGWRETEMEMTRRLVAAARLLVAMSLVALEHGSPDSS